MRSILVDAEAAIAAPAIPIQHDWRILLVLTLASFLAVINFSATAPFFPQIARDLDTTVPLLGQVPTAMTLLGLAVGPLAERYGYRRLMIIGIVGVAVNLRGTGLAPAYAALLGLAVAGGFGDAILFGLPLAIAGSTFQGDARRRAIARTSAALPAGSVLGVPLLALAGEVVTWRVVFIIAGIATLASASLAAAWLPQDGKVLVTQMAAWEPRVRRVYRQLLATYRPLLRHRPLLLM